MSAPTAEELEATVRRIAAESPDFTYKQEDSEDPICLYNPSPRNPQGCIIGAALASLGLPVPESMEGEGAYTVLPTMLKVAALPKGQSTWFDTVQGAQDGGKSWSAAVEAADERRRSLR